jgi:hypothetical protein
MATDEGEDISKPLYGTPVWAYLIGIILIVSAIVCSIGAWVFVYHYRNKPIVAIGQPEFMYNLCFGALLLPIGLVFLLCVELVDHNEDGVIPIDSNMGIFLNVCCNAVEWLIVLGFCIIYSSLLCKIFRIMKITQQPLRRGLKILPRHALWPFVLILILNVALLIAWSFSGTSKYMISEPTDTNQSFGYCEYIDRTQVDTASLAYFYTIIALALIVQVVLIFLACKIKKLNQELGDSKRILRLILFQAITNSVCNSLYAISDFLLLFIIQYVIYSISTIGFIILPRMYYVWYEHRHGHLPENVVMIGGGTTTVRGINRVTENIAAATTTTTTTTTIPKNDSERSNDEVDNGNDGVEAC